MQNDHCAACDCSGQRLLAYFIICCLSALVNIVKIKPQEVYVTAIIYFEQEFETGTWFIAFIQQLYDKIHQLSINSYIRVIIGFDYFGQTEILIKSIHILHYFFRVLLQQSFVLFEFILHPQYIILAQSRAE